MALFTNNNRVGQPASSSRKRLVLLALLVFTIVALLVIALLNSSRNTSVNDKPTYNNGVFSLRDTSAYTAAGSYYDVTFTKEGGDSFNVAKVSDFSEARLAGLRKQLGKDGDNSVESRKGYAIIKHALEGELSYYIATPLSIWRITFGNSSNIDTDRVAYDFEEDGKFNEALRK